MIRKGLEDREVKRGRGGIRDIEFAVQLLQLVHGGLDGALRSPTTLDALRDMAAGGYVDPVDAAALADAYCFLRKVEHRLQLVDELQVHAIPESPEAQTRLARTMGYRDTGSADAVDQFFAELGRHQATVRSIHERLYFRPLLEAFAALPSKAGDGDVGPLARPGATLARLSAFGFTEADRVREAVRELTSGLTRSSRLMQQMLPLLLEWLADAPDPDQGLLCLRNLASGRAALDRARIALPRLTRGGAPRVPARRHESDDGGRGVAQPRPHRTAPRLRTAAHSAEARAGRERTQGPCLARRRRRAPGRVATLEGTPSGRDHGARRAR